MKLSKALDLGFALFGCFILGFSVGVFVTLCIFLEHHPPGPHEIGKVVEIFKLLYLLMGVSLLFIATGLYFFLRRG